MDMLRTRNLGLIENPHGNKYNRAHMEYEHGITQEEREQIGGMTVLSVGEKMQTEDGNYDKAKKGRPDLKCDSNLEALTNAFWTRFGGTVKMHPYGKINFKNGIIYDVDMLVTMKDNEGHSIGFFVEPHCVENENADYELLTDSKSYGSLRRFEGNAINKILTFVRETGKTVIAWKPNAYFQIIARQDGKTVQFTEERSALCACPHCQSLFPAVTPTSGKCPVCGKHGAKDIMYGDQTGTNALSIKGEDPKKRRPRNLWYEASECVVTTPVRGEIWDDLQANDTYGTPFPEIADAFVKD